jgi:hypothetical protein
MLGLSAAGESDIKEFSQSGKVGLPPRFLARQQKSGHLRAGASHLRGASVSGQETNFAVNSRAFLPDEVMTTTGKVLLFGGGGLVLIGIVCAVAIGVWLVNAGARMTREVEKVLPPLRKSRQILFECSDRFA